ncbi:MAG: hypothetical protein BroJett040_20690 [Oligoflexia bacterium]|nr:MAG: hypothetical protein BroJett040_20690 [Oligoflexia bacterium]
MTSKGQSSKISRRDFLKSSASLSLATAIAGIHEKAQAGFYNMGAFWKGTSSAQAATVGNSLRFRLSASAYLSRTFGAPTNQSKWTLSTWIKRGNLSDSGSILGWYSGATNFCYLEFNYGTPGRFTFYWYNGGTVAAVETAAFYRDPSSWFHLVVQVDIAQGTPENRILIYVNGTPVTSFNTATYPSSAPPLNQSGNVHNIGGLNNAGAFDGYMMQYCFVDGLALTPDKFGAADSTTGEWKPLSSAQIRTNVVTAGGWGSNGFMLLFNDATSTTTLGYDRKTSDAGTGNDWTPTNISVTAGPTYDVMVDSPSNGSSGTRPAGNYCVLNPLSKGTYVTVSDGNLLATFTSGSVASRIGSSIAVSSGKWYWEATVVARNNPTYPNVGIVPVSTDLTGSASIDLSGTSGAFCIRGDGTNQLGAGYGSALSAGMVLGFALDFNAGTLVVYENNTSQGTLASGLSGSYVPAGGSYNGSNIQFNFGQIPFQNTSTWTTLQGSGFKAICTSNLPDPTISKPSQHFDVLTYTGTGGVKHVGQSGAAPSFGIPSTSFPFAVDNSLRLRASATAYLSRTFGATGNRRAWTFSCWVKRSTTDNSCIFSGAISGPTSHDSLMFYGNKLMFCISNSGGGSHAGQINSQRSFLDTSKWMHILCVFDSANATGSERMRLYVDGQQLAVAISPELSLNFDAFYFNNASAHNIGRLGTSYYFDGYIAEVHFIDGQTLTPSSFGQTESTTGTWVPKQYSGTYGTNGFYLPFSDTSQLTSGSNVGIGKDFSGNTNYWNTNNISLTAGVTYDAMIDSPTNAASGTRPVGNYATLNPLSDSGGTTFRAGNLEFTGGANSFYATMYVTSGKFYFEGKITQLITNTSTTGIGIVNISDGTDARYIRSRTPDLAAKVSSAAESTGYSYWVSNDVVGVAFDIDNNNFSIYINNTLIASASGTAALSGKTWIPQFQTQSAATPPIWQVNFGQRPFQNTTVWTTLSGSGYKTLCTANLPAPSSSLWTPDLVWIKDRTTANNYAIADSVRGAFGMLASNTTNAEASTTQAIQRFYPGGFTVGNDVTTGTNNDNYVAWMWKAGGVASTNTAGQLTSQVSVNATAGFSIVGWRADGTVKTVGHGLGAVPAMIMAKDRETAGTNWVIGHQNLNATSPWNYMLNYTTTAATLSAGGWNNTAPTSTVFTAGSSIYNSGKNYVAYCFAEIPGFSKFGTYTGNGVADGPFVWCGFRPRWILVKRFEGGTEVWGIFDTARDAFNVGNKRLYPNNPDVEYSTGDWLDVTANGFKIRGTAFNTSTGIYLFAALAEMPFKYANAR